MLQSGRSEQTTKGGIDTATSSRKANMMLCVLEMFVIHPEALKQREQLGTANRWQIHRLILNGMHG